jgi:hypothetical protein
MVRAREDFVERLPEAERAIANGNFRSDAPALDGARRPEVSMTPRPSSAPGTVIIRAR